MGTEGSNPSLSALVRKHDLSAHGHWRFWALPAKLPSAVIFLAESFSEESLKCRPPSRFPGPGSGLR